MVENGVTVTRGSQVRDTPIEYRQSHAEHFTGFSAPRYTLRAFLYGIRRLRAE